MRKTSRRAWRVVGGGVGAATLLGLGYVATQWLRYGHVRKRRGPPTLLDRFLPECEVLERHQTRVAAPADVTYGAAREMSLAGSPVVRAIFRGRELLMRSLVADRPEERPPQSLIDEVLSIGWGVLAQEPGREIVLGAVTQPWKSDVKFRALPPDEFAAFDKPGFAKIAWTILAEPLGYHRPVAISAEEGSAPKLDESPTRSGTFSDSAIDGRDLTWVPDPSRRSCVTAFPHRLRDELRTDRENRRTHGRSADGLRRGGDARQRVQPPA